MGRAWKNRWGSFIHKRSREEFGRCGVHDLEIGDHIYAYRANGLYQHHGIYVGEGKVVHYTSLKEPKQTCENCPDERDGVGIVCLGCFRKGDPVHKYLYGVSLAVAVSGPSTVYPCDDPEKVCSRALYLALKNGFGVYDLATHNCEDFSIYCKTGLLDPRNGLSRQIRLNFYLRNQFWLDLAIPAASPVLPGLLLLRSETNFVTESSKLERHQSRLEKVKQPFWLDLANFAVSLVLPGFVLLRSETNFVTESSNLLEQIEKVKQLCARFVKQELRPGMQSAHSERKELKRQRKEMDRQRRSNVDIERDCPRLTSLWRARILSPATRFQLEIVCSFLPEFQGEIRYILEGPNKVLVWPLSTVLAWYREGMYKTKPNRKTVGLAAIVS